MTTYENINDQELKIAKILIQILNTSERDTSKISYNQTKTYLSVLFYNIPCMRIKNGKKTKFISIKNYLNYTLKLCNNINFVVGKDGWSRIDLENEMDVLQLSQPILEIYDYCYAKSSGELFGCCHRYVECSDKRKCIIEDNPLSKGCIYRQNLINGKIFYGKNANHEKVVSNNVV